MFYVLITLLVLAANIIMGLDEENLSLGFGNNKDADLPAHLLSLISTFVILILESIISKLATGKVSIFKLVPEVRRLVCWKP